MTNALKINKDAKYLECQRMKMRYPMFIDATIFTNTSSKKHIKSDLVEAFEKVEFDPYDISVFIRGKYKKYHPS